MHGFGLRSAPVGAKRMSTGHPAPSNARVHLDFDPGFEVSPAGSVGAKQAPLEPSAL